MSSDYQKRQAKSKESDEEIIECLHSVDTLECLESLVNTTRDRVAAFVLAEQYEKLGFGHRSNAQHWRVRALANLSELEIARIENTARRLLSASSTGIVHSTPEGKFDKVNSETDKCLHSNNVIADLDSLARRTGDRVAAYVLSNQYEKTRNRSLADQWRNISLSGLSSKDERIVKTTADKLLSFSHEMSSQVPGEDYSVLSSNRVDYASLAKYIKSEFDRRVKREYVDYFAAMGFDAQSVLDSKILFQFMSVISFDMRPLDYKQVWGPPNHPEYNRNSIRQALKDLDLANVRATEKESLRESLHRRTLKIRNDSTRTFFLDMHDWGEKGKVDHARGLKELAEKITNVAQLLSDLPSTGDVSKLYTEIDAVHGFGPALTSKTILFIVRCFGIGLARVNPRDLRPVSEGILGEYVVQTRATRLKRADIKIDALLNELTGLGDPLAIELLYLLDIETDFQKLLKEGRVPGS